jgi:hypothetical protein
MDFTDRLYGEMQDGGCDQRIAAGGLEFDDVFEPGPGGGMTSWRREAVSRLGHHCSRKISTLKK